MDKKTIDNVIDFAINNIKTVALTRGAPEINKYFQYMIKKLKKNNIHIVNRYNLIIMEENGITKTLDDLINIFDKKNFSHTFIRVLKDIDYEKDLLFI